MVNVQWPTGTEALDELCEVVAQIAGIGRLRPDLPTPVDPPDLERAHGALRQPFSSCSGSNRTLTKPPTLKPISTKVPTARGEELSRRCPRRSDRSAVPGVRAHSSSVTTTASSQPRGNRRRPRRAHMAAPLRRGGHSAGGEQGGYVRGPVGRRGGQATLRVLGQPLAEDLVNNLLMCAGFSLMQPRVGWMPAAVPSL